MKELIAKAEVLVESLPYIKTFAGKTFVIKYGGQAMISEELKKSVVIDIILLKYIGINPVLIHGGGKEVTNFMQRLGKEASFVNGLRITSKEDMEIVEMVLMGKVNKDIVSLFNKYGGNAVGLSGKDSNLFLTEKRLPEKVLKDGRETRVDLGYVGEISQVNPKVIKTLIEADYIPVISSIGVDLEGQSYNINADHAAGEVAAALSAEKLILLTDVEGIFADHADKDSLISSLSREKAYALIEEGKINAGMIPKVEACLRGLENNVGRTHIVDGRLSHSLLLEIFTDKGIGTMVTP